MGYTFHALLMANQTLFNKDLFARLRDTELTIGHPRILDYLSEHDGENQKQIARGCNIEPSTLTTILNGMEEKKMIERRALNNDRRSTHIFMTEKGRELQKIVKAAFEEMEENAFKGFSEKEQREFMDMFLKVYCNISGREEI